MSAVLRSFLLLMTLSVARPVMCAADDAAPLTNLADLFALSHEKVDPRVPVRITGVVTFVEPTWGYLIVQDGKHGVSIKFASGVDFPEQLKAGDRVSLEGRSSGIPNSPAIITSEVLRIGDGETPEAIRLTAKELICFENQKCFLECEGTVYRASGDDRHLYLDVVTDHSVLNATVCFAGDAPSADKLLGQKVGLRGVLLLSEQDNGSDPRILLDDSRFRLLSPEQTNGDNLSFSRLTLLKHARDTGEKRFKIIGQAISDSRSSELIVQDRTGTVQVSSSQLPDIHVGDIIVVAGDLRNGGRGLPVITGEVTRIAPGKTLVPVEVSVEEAHAYPYRYVATEAEFRGFRRSGEKRFPVLREGKTSFTISGSDETMAAFESLSDRSLVKVTGACWPESGPAYAFEVLANQIDILFEPPQPAVKEIEMGPMIEQTLAALSPRRADEPNGPVIVASVALILMAVLLVAFLIVLRRMREQRHFYATIHEQLNQVSHVSRLNTLSEMVGSLAHELNQPLASVTNFAETARILSQRSESETPQLADILKRISSESVRAGEIIRRLRTLVQRKTPGRISSSMNQIVEDSLDMFRMQELVTDGLLDVRLEVDLPRIEVDPIQLQQVILNFLLNARDATTGLQGRLPKIVITTSCEDGKVVVAVDDNGPGIVGGDPDAMFEPYFTTKSEGLGLGLAISRTIVEMHNGTIHAENLKPCGIRLTATLPAAEGDQQAAA